MQCRHRHTCLKPSAHAWFALSEPNFHVFIFWYFSFFIFIFEFSFWSLFTIQKWKMIEKLNNQSLKFSKPIIFHFTFLSNFHFFHFSFLIFDFWTSFSFFNFAFWMYFHGGRRLAAKGLGCRRGPGKRYSNMGAEGCSASVLSLVPQGQVWYCYWCAIGQVCKIRPL